MWCIYLKKLNPAPCQSDWMHGEPAFGVYKSLS
uniref:Uncharacterized protein n=1 Tax=Anguilla anguilla TaxID=7936 RepID=A0A0E9XCV7_ANGAN